MIRSSRVVVRCIFSAGILLLCSCDKSSAPPRITAKAPTDVAATPAPTTQELMSGPYKKITLTPLPLSAQVPQSWDIATVPNTQISLLKGPGIDGRDIEISLQVGTSLNPDQLKNVLEGATRASTRASKNLRLFKIRDMDDMKVMEEQRTFVSPELPAEQLIDWKVTYFIHRDLDYSPMVINALGMTLSQFEQSKDLLRKIIDSIVYEGGRAL